ARGASVTGPQVGRRRKPTNRISQRGLIVWRHEKTGLARQYDFPASRHIGRNHRSTASGSFEQCLWQPFASGWEGSNVRLCPDCRYVVHMAGTGDAWRFYPFAEFGGLHRARIGAIHITRDEQIDGDATVLQQADRGNKRAYAFVIEQASHEGDGWCPAGLGRWLQAFNIDTRAQNERDVTGGNPERKQSVAIVRVLHQSDVSSAHAKKSQQKYNKRPQQPCFYVFGNEGEAEPGQGVHACGAATDGSK